MPSFFTASYIWTKMRDQTPSMTKSKVDLATPKRQINSGFGTTIDSLSQRIHWPLACKLGMVSIETRVLELVEIMSREETAARVLRITDADFFTHPLYPQNSQPQYLPHKCFQLLVHFLVPSSHPSHAKRHLSKFSNHIPTSTFSQSGPDQTTMNNNDKLQLLVHQWWVSVNLNLIACFYEYGVNKLAIFVEK